MYENTKQYVSKHVQQLYVNYTNAVKDRNASKLQKLRRICGGSEPTEKKVSFRVSEKSDKITWT
jgi:hypothetical protein